MNPLILAAVILVADADPDREAIACSYRALERFALTTNLPAKQVVNNAIVSCLAEWFAPGRRKDYPIKDLFMDVPISRFMILGILEVEVIRRRGVPTPPPEPKPEWPA